MTEPIVVMQLILSDDRCRELSQEFIKAAVAVLIAAQKQESTR